MNKIDKKEISSTCVIIAIILITLYFISGVWIHSQQIKAIDNIKGENIMYGNFKRDDCLNFCKFMGKE